MITLRTPKGTNNFETVDAAAKWLEEYQPATADVSDKDGERVEVQRDGDVWDAEAAEAAIYDALTVATYA